ncbi:MAG: ABC transporter ATP-binding protein [Acidobacteriaceae bacterium]
MSLSIRAVLRPHRAALSLGLLAALGEALANLLEPWPLKLVLDAVLKSKNSTGWLWNLVHRIAGTDKFSILHFACFAVLGIAIFDAICTYAEKYLTTSVGQWVTHDLRRSLYAHMQRMSLAFHTEARTGDLISRVTDDIDSVQSFITSNMLGGLVDAITLAGMIGVMFYLSWQFTLIALSVAPILFFIVYTYTRNIKKASRAVRKKEGEILSVVEEALTSIRIVKAFAREDYEVKRLENQSLETVEVSLKARTLKAKLQPMVQVIVAIGTGLVLWFGTRLVLRGSISTGSLIVFLTYLGKMYKPMQDLSKMTDSYSKAAVGYERIKEVLQADSTIPDLPRAKRAPRFKGLIEFVRVSFQYQNEQPILSNVSFEIRPGKMVALVGPTGAGKSTIVSLISRFYDPTHGIVLIDGTDVRQFKQESLRQQISWVLQDCMLFHSTIWQNIAYGKPNATRDEIIRAAELANASEFIDKLPDGYDTLVGERGMTLSGGQRQRLAIARAIIRNSPILILDEPTSGLDAASEKLVFEAIERLIEGKTCIVIAHRLATIRKADEIFVIQDGGIIERGTHDQLVAQGGTYAELANLQFPEEVTA